MGKVLYLISIAWESFDSMLTFFLIEEYVYRHISLWNDSWFGHYGQTFHINSEIQGTSFSNKLHPRTCTYRLTDSKQPVFIFMIQSSDSSAPSPPSVRLLVTKGSTPCALHTPGLSSTCSPLTRYTIRLCHSSFLSSARDYNRLCLWLIHF